MQWHAVTSWKSKLGRFRNTYYSVGLLCNCTTMHREFLREIHDNAGAQWHVPFVEILPISNETIFKSLCMNELSTWETQYKSMQTRTEVGCEPAARRVQQADNISTRTWFLAG